MNPLDFEQYLAARSDGYWELLATANPASLSKTIAGLEASAFREGTEGRAGTPSLVQQRVEALAAHRPQLLVELSKGWTKPRDMSRNLMNEENDFLFGAWLSSIRFLAGAGAVSVGDLATDLVGISEEAKVCFGSRVVEVSDWNESCGDSRRRNFRLLREQSASRLQVELSWQQFNLTQTVELAQSAYVWIVNSAENEPWAKKVWEGPRPGEDPLLYGVRSPTWSSSCRPRARVPPGQTLEFLRDGPILR